MDVFSDIVKTIIKEQELVIGPLAWEEAGKVSGLKVDAAKNSVDLASSKDQTDVVNSLVKQYERLFGQASVEVCKDAVRDLIHDMPKDKIPAQLR